MGHFHYPWLVLIVFMFFVPDTTDTNQFLNFNVTFLERSSLSKVTRPDDRRSEIAHNTLRWDTEQSNMWWWERNISVWSSSEKLSGRLTRDARFSLREIRLQYRERKKRKQLVLRVNTRNWPARLWLYYPGQMIQPGHRGSTGRRRIGTSKLGSTTWRWVGK